MALSLTSGWEQLNVARHKAEFYRMWLAGYSAGLPHASTMSTMGEIRRSSVVDALRRHIIDGTRRGDSLARLVQAHRDLTVPFEAALLEFGEESGRLEGALRLLADYFAAEHRMMLRVKKELAYPMSCGVAAAFIAPFPVLYFGNVGAYLLTVALEFALIIGAGGTVLLSVARWYRQRPRFVLGRLCRALAACVEAGLSLDRVVVLAAKASGHPDLIQHVQRMSARQRGTQPLADTFRGAPLVPFEIVAALEVADASGNHRDTLGKLAALYDGEYAR